MEYFLLEITDRSGEKYIRLVKGDNINDAKSRAESYFPYGCVVDIIETLE